MVRKPGDVFREPIADHTLLPRKEFVAKAPQPMLGLGVRPPRTPVMESPVRAVQRRFVSHGKRSCECVNQSSRFRSASQPVSQTSPERFAADIVCQGSPVLCHFLYHHLLPDRVEDAFHETRIAIATEAGPAGATPAGTGRRPVPPRATACVSRRFTSRVEQASRLPFPASRRKPPAAAPRRGPPRLGPTGGSGRKACRFGWRGWVTGIRGPSKRLWPGAGGLSAVRVRFRSGALVGP